MLGAVDNAGRATGSNSVMPRATSHKDVDPSTHHMAVLMNVMIIALPLPALAVSGGAAAASNADALPAVLWAYAHYFSILVILGCLSAERTLVSAGMSEEEENAVVKLDLVYGIMVALL